LASAYRYSRSQVAIALKQVLVTDCFEVERHALAWLSLHDYGLGMGDFAD